VPQGMIGRLIESGQCCEMEINVETNWGNEKLRTTILSTGYDRWQGWRMRRI